MTVLSLFLLAFMAHSPGDPGTVSPDGRWRATVREERIASPDRPGSTSLWLTDLRSRASRLLLSGRTAEDPRRDTARLARPRFSPDGRAVYVEAATWATSAAIHRVEVASGAERYVTDGSLLGVVTSGPHRGALVTQPHRYRRGGGSYDPFLLVRPDGRPILRVPGGEADPERWLARRGWTMR
jgi:dipeptidyl aminopeptidase/acylaminoacyl peptidase